MSTWTSPHSSVGISARRRSINASPVETIWITAAWPSPQVALDGRDQRRRLHRRDEMVEETLLGAFEGGPRRGLCLRVQRAGCAGDVRRPHGRFEIVMDDREGARIGVVDADLFVGERCSTSSYSTPS